MPRDKSIYNNLKLPKKHSKALVFTILDGPNTTSSSSSSSKQSGPSSNSSGPSTPPPPPPPSNGDSGSTKRTYSTAPEGDRLYETEKASSDGKDERKENTSCPSQSNPNDKTEVDDEQKVMDERRQLAIKLTLASIAFTSAFGYLSYLNIQ